MSMRLPFFNNKQKFVQELKMDNLPEHVAIIMDGNGRWANKKGLPRIAGHKEGMDVVQKVVRAAVKYKIKILTLYAFSTENWKRPKPEVDFLMRLPKEFLHVYLPEMMQNNVKIETIGEFDGLPERTKRAIQYAKDKTKNNDGLLLIFAINYGSRNEIMRAIRRVAEDVENGALRK
ncbi:MAG TPA: polyprenyl diphosphate synthase, partial [Pseudogracilibacillus sp.]|nr:polyprenyl diphosphate synthase [Pseudogracilibacillus sp.]